MNLSRILNRMADWKSVIRALKYPNFRLFFAGQSISLVGTWIQQIAMSWLVYRLTKSAFLLGVVGFTSQIPTFLLAPFAGVLADHWNRHRMIIFTQIFSMIQALLLAVLVLTNMIAVWQIIILSIFLGLINAFDIPARQSFIVEMIEDKSDLGNAIALNSTMVNSARLIGPSIAGILISLVGEGFCFLINGLSYLAVILSLILMKIVSQKVTTHRPDVIKGLKEGFSYAFAFPPIRAIILLLALISLMGSSYMVLMPIVATKVLHGGAHTLGFLMGAAGLGALIGAIYLAARRSVRGLFSMLPFAGGLFGFSLLIFSLSRSLWFSFILLLITGFGMIMQMASSNTVLQTIVDDNKRGRVMSIYTMAFMGMAPFGSLLVGGLANSLGVPVTLMLSGLVSIIGSLFFAWKLPSLRESIRPIYVKMGIIQEVSPGIPTPPELAPPEK